ncbi:TPA: hypothetical protein RFV71_002695, partial [Klebsiella quasipneumoniae subsp. quasipneumoniae]|nr:hypothetical protein [Klebsiella quasipneumoniae subsp. quasipneumoniae]
GLRARESPSGAEGRDQERQQTQRAARPDNGGHDEQQGPGGEDYAEGDGATARVDGSRSVRGGMVV